MSTASLPAQHLWCLGEVRKRRWGKFGVQRPVKAHPVTPVIPTAGTVVQMGSTGGPGHQRQPGAVKWLGATL